MDGEHREHDSLINMRTHLTVLTLALGHLQRRHGDDADIARLCRYADDAIRQLREDIAAVEATLLQAERREASRHAHLQMRQSVGTDSGRLETGSLDRPRPAPARTS